MPKRERYFLDKFPWHSSKKMSIAFWRLYGSTNTPKHRRKKWSFYGIFFRGAPRGVAAIEQPR
jgi:hypothetical protein